jgi:hypothetical protein
MSETEVVAETSVVKKEKKLKPARKQVKPGQVEKKEAPQTGKEYSACRALGMQTCAHTSSIRHLVQQVGRR